MVDRGTALSFDAPQYEFDVFTHVMEPLASFPAAYSFDGTMFETDLSSYGHPFEAPLDFGGQFMVFTSAGWYMTEANTHDKQLQGAPNGRSSVSGSLVSNLTLTTATAAGTSALTAAALLKDMQLSAAAVAGASSITSALKNTKNLAGGTDGSSSTSGNLKIPGKYQQAVLADSPSTYLTGQADPISGSGIAYNHPSLGGAQFGTIDTFNGPWAGPSLVQTESSPSVRSSHQVQRSSTSTVQTTIPVSHSLEFWYQQTYDVTGDSIFTGYGNDALSNSFYFLRLSIAADGTFQAQRAYGSGYASYAVLSSGFSVLDWLSHHFVVTWDGFDGPGRLSLYVDGELRDSQYATSGAPGAALTSPTMYFSQGSGSVDEMAFYGAALTAAQVRAHYLAAWETAAPLQMRGKTSASAQLGLTYKLAGSPSSAVGFAYVPPSKLIVQRLSPLSGQTAAGSSQVAGDLNVVTSGGPVVPLSGQADGSSVVAGSLDTYLYSPVALAATISCGAVVLVDLAVAAMFDVTTDGVPTSGRREFT